MKIHYLIKKTIKRQHILIMLRCSYIGGEKMKTFKDLFNRVVPVLTACLTLVLFINANTSSCFFLEQSKEPESIKKFKMMK